MIMQDNEKKPALRFKGFTDPWEQRKLDELGTIVTGSTPSTTNDAYYADDGLLWVTPTDITKNITCESARKLSASGQKVARVVPRNTILVTCIASIGKNTMLANAGSFNQQINGLTPDENKYVPYFLLTESVLWSAKMKVLAATGTLQIINRTEFSEIKTFLPSFDEQKRISQYFEKLDTLITLHQRKYEKLVNIKKSMLDKMFPKNGASVPEIRFKGFTDPWEQRKLTNLCEKFTDGDWIEAKDQSDSGVRLVQTGNVGVTEYLDKPNNKKWISFETFEQLHCEEVYPGDILISRLPEPAGRACIMPNLGTKMITAVDCTIVRPNAVTSTRFLLQYLSSQAYFDAVNTCLAGGTRQRISRGNLAQFNVPIPSSKIEQEKIGEVLEKLDTLITLHQRKLEKLQNIKKSCLEKMFV